MIPDVEKVIADIKAGNDTQALTDLLALVPELQKAYTDCTSGAKNIGKKFFGSLMKGKVNEDPKREYFEKIGAEFARGFLAGTKVGELDSIDLYNCLHREPKAVEIFYKADETLKESLLHKHPDGVIKAIDETLFFVVEMVMEDFPRTHIEVCREFKEKDLQFADLKHIIELMRGEGTTLAFADGKTYFNH